MARLLVSLLAVNNIEYSHSKRNARLMRNAELAWPVSGSRYQGADWFWCFVVVNRVVSSVVVLLQVPVALRGSESQHRCPEHRLAAHLCTDSVSRAARNATRSPCHLRGVGGVRFMSNQ